MSEVIICPKCNKAGVIPMWDPVHNITYKACRFCGKAYETIPISGNLRRVEYFKELIGELDKLMEQEEIDYKLREKINAIMDCILADMEDR